MRRRDFIALVGGAAAAWPLVAHAEQSEKLRRVGILNPMAKADLVARDWDTAFRQRFGELGWVNGRNVQVD